MNRATEPLSRIPGRFSPTAPTPHFWAGHFQDNFCRAGYSLNDALVNGPTWFQNYGLYGMHYGAQQIFGDTLRPALEKNPALNFVVSPSWANATEQFVSFFIPPEMQSRVQLGQPTDLLNNTNKFTFDSLFVATPDEYGNLMHDPKFKDINIRETIPYPNAQPGFYVITLKPADNINEKIILRRKLCCIQRFFLMERTPLFKACYGLSLRYSL
jgi:hypothetical protein